MKKLFQHVNPVPFAITSIAVLISIGVAFHSVLRAQPDILELMISVGMLSLSGALLILSIELQPKNLLDPIPS